MVVDLTGQRFGDYRLKHLLSDRGAFADVYEGEHIVDRTQVATKVWKVQVEAKIFLNEIHAVVLTHPHIVKILDFGIKSDIPYLVMAYAPYGSLQKQRLPLSLVSVVTYVREIADALHYAHQRGIVHRDIKPDNILLGPQHEIWVGDFGVAARCYTREEELEELPVAGTYPYMAPEQMQGHASFASDQYSLGIMAYEWLCGERPFRGNIAELYYQHNNAPPPPLRRKVPTISPLVEQVVMRTLEKVPEKRYASVKEFAQALGRAYQVEQHTGFPTMIKTPLGTLLHTYQIPQGCKYAFSWTQTGPRIACGETTGKIVVQDVATGKLVSTHTSLTESAVDAIAWAPDGRYFASYARQKPMVQVWDVDSGNIVASYTNVINSRNAIAWSPDSTHIALISTAPKRSTLQIREIHTKKHVTHTINCPKRSECECWEPTWSPDGIYIALLYCWRNGPYESWSLDIREAHTSRGRIISCSLPDPPYPKWTLHSSPNARWRWNGGNIVWAPHSDSIVAQANYAFTGAYHLDGSVQEEDIRPSQIGIWETATGNEVARYLDAQSPVWSPDGSQVAFVSKTKRIEVRDRAGQHMIGEYCNHSTPIVSVVWSPDGRNVASVSVDGIIHIWNSHSAQFILTLDSHSRVGTTRESIAPILLSWSPDGTQIASINRGRTVRIWQVV
jgi:eukaryotic-like serine/threonine-protein kinase